MAKGEIYLGLTGSESLLSPFGRKTTITDVEFARIERTSSSRLIKDFKEGSPKKMFTLAYDMIDGDDLEDLIDLYLLHTELSLIVYTSAVLFDQYDVVMSPLERERILLLENGLWSGVSITLEEI